MVVFPNAKLNIGLNIVEKRPDNYHNLESIFVPIPFKDILEIVESKSGETRLHLSGIQIDGDPNNNLVMKAFRQLQVDFNIPNVDIYLEKIIPFGAGLGGGSADAAFTLKALNTLFDLKLSNEKLCQYAAKLGADCSFFIENKATYVTGIGEILTPIELDLSPYYLVLVKPNDYISTKEAYAHITPRKTKISVNETIHYPIEQWKEYIVNDFEASVFPNHPNIAKVKKNLYENGALYASMTGSGSSVFGLFDKQPTVEFENTVFKGKF